MCGFVGLVNNFKSDINTNKKIIKSMNNLIDYRGPDSEGYWNNDYNNIFFGHKRLSIVDLSNYGSQPMTSNNKKFTIVFNGEIYNHNDMRRSLKSSFNLSFKGLSDTETLLESISYLGVDKTLAEIEGMFAFALWNQEDNLIYLARDIAGEKPLYYSEITTQNNNRSLIFGSELKIFNAYPNFDKKINLEAVNYQQLYKYIPSPLSIYENTFKIQPGTYLKYEINNSKKTISTFWKVDDIISSSKKNIYKESEVSIIQNTKKVLNKSVKQQLLGDVEVGAFLSGGTDSSLVVSIMQRNSDKKVKTFTVGFDNKEFDESKNAKKIANYLNTDHNELYLESADLINVIPKISTIYDEPFSDSSQIPTYLISKFASTKVKVCLSGDGGDELFAGYNRYAVTEKIWKYIRLMPYQMRLMVSKILRSISPNRWNRLLKWCEILLSRNNKYVHYGDKIHKGGECLKSKTIEDLYYFLISDLKNNYSNNLNNYETQHMKIPHSNVGNLNSVEFLMRNDFINYLPNDILTKVDRAAMANSLETRMPFLSKNVIEESWKIPHHLKIKNNQSKYLLKKIISEYIPSDYIEHTKKGFSIPLANWLRNDLEDWVESSITKSKIEKYDIFDYKQIKTIWDDHKSQKFNNHSQIWNILIMQNWLEANT